ncbi:uncharacterized protein LOC106092272 [Stomoxys calcitrans]|uniref:uncharacterized protein LOC106092272 n=1 Tax=Stomoxys calcitrans TaxID=35570 RepID=UPI0027E2B8B4|nr:uncharacterized protein LOC106092272 [Stomoxys calcitrans]
MDLFKVNYDEREKIWSGSKIVPLHNIEHHSPGRILFSQMKMRPSKVIQIDDFDGKTLTNQEMLNFSIRIARHLKKMGMGHDDIVGMAAQNTTYLAPAVLGCFLNCTPFHAIHPNFKEAAAKHCFGITKPSIIFCDGSNYEIIKNATIYFKPAIYTLSDHIEGVPSILDLLEPTEMELFFQPEPLTLGADQTVAILCSSGTTGLPKAVTLSARTIVLETFLLNGESVYYSPSCLDWVSGLISLVMNIYSSCTRIISRKTFTSEYFMELMGKYGITCAMLSPMHISALTLSPQCTTEKMSTLQCVTSGGAGISAQTLTKFQSIVPKCMICFGYGCTEFGGIASNIGLGRANSVGKVLFNVKLRIVDDDGKNLGPHKVGEVVVQSPFKWGGYYSNPMETQRVLDSKGWYYTGDLGYMDEEHFLYIVDRKKDILKYRSLHFWPGEIENVVLELKEVVDCCVVGIFDERFGDLAGALVVKRKDAAITAQQIVNYVKERLVEPEKQLHSGVRFVEELPHNNNGKVLKREAREMFQKLMQLA